MTISQQRAQLRKNLREARRNLSEKAQSAASKAITQQLLSMDEIKSAKHCAFYLSNDGEVCLDGFFVRASKYKTPAMRFALPVLHPFTKGHLLFLSYNDSSAMIKNRYGIDEPVLDCRAVVPPTELDVVLLPLVGFDYAGNRLGMGGGFYDRTFARVNSWEHKPALVGIAHDCQCVDALPVESWDVPLDAIVTPSRVIYS